MTASVHAGMSAFTHEQKWRGRGEEEVGEEGEECLCIQRKMVVGGWAFKFCDICSLQLECVYFYTASHKQRARLAPLVNVPAYNSKANEIFTARQQEWGEKWGQRREEKNDMIICDKNMHKCLALVHIKLSFWWKRGLRNKQLIIKRPGKLLRSPYVYVSKNAYMKNVQKVITLSGNGDGTWRCAISTMDPHQRPLNGGPNAR